MVKVTSIHRYLKNCNKVLFIFLMFVVSVLITIVFSPLFDLLDTTAMQSSNVASGGYEFFKFVIFIPLFETLIFQFLVIEFLYLTRMGKMKIVVLSAIIFSAIHYYSIGYIVYAFSMGVIFSYSYVIRENATKAFLTVYAIHLLRNTLTFLLRVFGM